METTMTTIFAGKKTRNSIYLAQTIRNMFVHIACKNIKYNLTTKTDRKCLYAELLNALESYFLRANISSMLKSFGIGTADKFADAIIDERDYLENIEKLKLGSLILEKRLTKNQMIGKSLVDENGAGVSIDELNEVSLSDVERLVVVRTKYGTHEPKVYKVKGTLTPQTTVAVRHMYSYESGCNYYDARAILYTTWIELPYEYQMASSPMEEDDLCNVNE